MQAKSRDSYSGYLLYNGTTHEIILMWKSNPQLTEQKAKLLLNCKASRFSV